MRNKAIVALLLLSISGQASAGIPMTMYDRLFAQIYRNLQTMTLAEIKAQVQEQFNVLNNNVGEKTIDSWNNAYANVITRTTQTDSDLFNLELLSESLPSAIACNQLSKTVGIDELICAAKNTMYGLNSEVSANAAPYEIAEAAGDGSASSYTNSSSYTDADGDGRVTMDDVYRDIVTRYHNNENYLTSSIYKMSSGNPEFLTLSPSDFQAAKDAIVLLSPPYDYSGAYTDVETRDDVKGSVYAMQDEATNSLSYHTLSKVLSLKASSNPDAAGPSLWHMTSRQADSFYGDEKSMAVIAATTSVTSPAQMYRYIATAKAMQIHMQLDAYKQSLDDEVIQAKKLLLLLDSQG